jgi:hypothetical protein
MRPEDGASDIMKAFVYRNTKSDIPGWDSVHEKQPRGMAYETDRLLSISTARQRGFGRYRTVSPSPNRKTVSFPTG